MLNGKCPWSQHVGRKEAAQNFSKTAALSLLRFVRAVASISPQGRQVLYNIIAADMTQKCSKKVSPTIVSCSHSMSYSKNYVILLNCSCWKHWLYILAPLYVPWPAITASRNVSARLVPLKSTGLLSEEVLSKNFPLEWVEVLVMHKSTAPKNLLSQWAKHRLILSALHQQTCDTRGLKQADGVLNVPGTDIWSLTLDSQTGRVRSTPKALIHWLA